VRFHEDRTAVEKLVAPIQRLLLQPFHGFVGVKCEVGVRRTLGKANKRLRKWPEGTEVPG